LNEVLLLKQGEIVLKGLNKKMFESTLLSNIRRRLKTFGDYNIYAKQSTIYVEPMGDCDIDGAIEACKCIFGVATISRAVMCEKDKDAVLELAASYLKDYLDNIQTFKVETKRADKLFPMNSIQLSQYVGGLLQDKFPHLKPQMRNPDFTVYLEVRELGIYIHGPAISSAGGLPVGTGGSMVALLSGGIDSPVAMYMMAKRGVRILPVHFFSPPYTSEQAKDKVLHLAKILTKYCGRMAVDVVPFTKISEEIRKKCPEALITIIMRRFMIRITQHIAMKNGCTAIITGDNLGQVASQTIEAITVVEECVSLPVLRPVIAFDKSQIIDFAREIGTYDTSILPYDDCCGVFTPRRPKTKPKLTDVLSAENKLDINALLNEAIEGIECIHIDRE